MTMPKARHAVAWWVLVLGLSACEREIVPEPYVPTSAHDGYRHALEEAGLLTTALGRDWLEAAGAALRSPVDVAAPFRESFYVDPAAAFAAGYRFSVRRGQRTEIRVDVAPAADGRLFIDLFREPDEGTEEGPVHVASGGEGDLRLAFEPRKDGVYVLRLQSELLRGGSCNLEIRNVASLAFPVEGHDTRAIWSSFGAPREGGRREHHGVDIFAPRHTDVTATSRARVRRVDDWKLGGRVVWLEDPERDLRLYFAHLETQDVAEGVWVSPGDKIGTVGNSGNARTTPPHLHFGIYVRGEGPIDPRPFLEQPRSEPRPVRADPSRLGAWVRTSKRGASLWPQLHGKPEPLRELPPGTAMQVLAGSGSHYRVSLPNGLAGFVSERDVESIATPLASVNLVAPAALRDRPAPEAATVRRARAGERVEIAGSFGDYRMVIDRTRLAWLLARSAAAATSTAP